MSNTSRVDVALNRLAVLACFLAIAVLIWSVTSDQAPLQYEVGERFDRVPEVDFKAAPATLIIWLDSECAACGTSMPFYQRLALEGGRTRLVAMGREPVGVLRAYLEKFGVRPAQVVSVGADELKFKGTPTLVLVGPDAVVRYVWFGKRRSITEEESVIGKITS